mmetsp:Transcript_40851/g.127970  ORF Transcript_40851/g.127970 Transcript_40851/m.127970 type:complete len:351 (-) Transcript_40851:131-1183(-)
MLPVLLRAQVQDVVAGRPPLQGWRREPKGRCLLLRRNPQRREVRLHGRRLLADVGLVLEVPVQTPEDGPRLRGLVHGQGEERATQVQQHVRRPGVAAEVGDARVELPLRRLEHAQRFRLGAGAPLQRQDVAPLPSQDANGVLHGFGGVAVEQRWPLEPVAPRLRGGLVRALAPVVAVELRGAGLQRVEVEHALEALQVAIHRARGLLRQLNAVEGHVHREQHLGAQDHAQRNALQQRDALVDEPVADLDLDRQRRQALQLRRGRGLLRVGRGAAGGGPDAQTGLLPPALLEELAHLLDHRDLALARALLLHDAGQVAGAAGDMQLEQLPRAVEAPKAARAAPGVVLRDGH